MIKATRGNFVMAMAVSVGKMRMDYLDVITTDLHSINIEGRPIDLPWVMSEFLHLGNLRSLRSL